MKIWFICLGKIALDIVQYKVTCMLSMNCISNDDKSCYVKSISSQCIFRKPEVDFQCICKLVEQYPAFRKFSDRSFIWLNSYF